MISHQVENWANDKNMPLCGIVHQGCQVIWLHSRIQIFGTPQMMADLAGDPRVAAKVVPFKLKVNPEELPADFMALFSLVFGVMGLMLRYKFAAWGALFCSIASVTNMRKAEIDFKQIFCSIT
jgi:hypothetical protein